EKAAHREKRLDNDGTKKRSSFVPKIFKSHQEKSPEEIEDGMTVSDDYMSNSEITPDINTDKLTEPDNQEPDYGEMYMFEETEEEQEENNTQNELVPYTGMPVQTNESSENMTNIQKMNEEKEIGRAHVTRKDSADSSKDLPLRQPHKNPIEQRRADRHKHNA